MRNRIEREEQQCSDGRGRQCDEVSLHPFTPLVIGSLPRACGAAASSGVSGGASAENGLGNAASRRFVYSSCGCCNTRFVGPC